ncbi:MAG: acyl-CoA thioesterase [Bacteroidota bacterium]
MAKFETPIEVRWADVDQNRHVRHSAYYDYGAHNRIRFFVANGFPADKLAALNIGPILFKEECSFIRELHPDETITINLLKGSVSENGARWVLHHEIFKGNGEKAAHITIKGAWMDLAERKLTIPPLALAEALYELDQGEDFVYKKT